MSASFDFDLEELAERAPRPLKASLCLVCGSRATGDCYGHEQFGHCDTHARDVEALYLELLDLAGEWIDRNNAVRDERYRTRGAFTPAGERFYAPSALGTTLENAVRRDLQGGPAAQWSGGRINGHRR